MSAGNGNPDIVHVVGAGLVGSVTAIGLARIGYRVKLFDRREDPVTTLPDRGRSVNVVLSARGWKLLQSLGLTDEIQKICTPLVGRAIHPWRGEIREQSYSSRGDQIWCVERPRLHQILARAVARVDEIECHWHHQLESVDLDQKLIYLSRSSTGNEDSNEHISTEQVQESYKRLLGTDGAFSVARSQLLHHTFDFQQKYLDVAYREMQIPSHQEGGPHLALDRFHVWPRGRLFLGAFPNQDGSFTGSLFLPREGFPSFATIDTKRDFAGFLRNFFPDLEAWLPQLSRQFLTNPSSPMVTMRCQPWILDDQLALLGDAAHAVVPFLGQGMNCGFEDAGELCEQLTAHDHDWGVALPAYEKRRRPNSDALAQLSLDHYEHLNHIPDPLDETREKIGAILDEIAPEKFRPLYELVAFTHIPYASALRLQQLRHQTIETIVRDSSFQQGWPDDARERIEQHLEADSPWIRELPTSILPGSLPHPIDHDRIPPSEA